jgi:2-oxoglutarate dehydrogenase E1 component
VVWAQDEPQNQGPWFQIQHNIFESMDGPAPGVRRPSGFRAPAVGYADKHVAQQKELLETAFSKLKGFILTK